jgi:hypothetical protein
LAALVLGAALACACAGNEKSNPAAPSAAASVPAASGTSPAAADATGTDGMVTTATEPSLSDSLGLIGPGGAAPSIVNFPPRNEPFAFRNDLEIKYRDQLHRGATSSFVDIEGTIVWTQEYLRYRVNGCGHVEAVLRVFLQIDGFGVQPVCSIFENAFPPRNEPFDFMLQLNAKYRDTLRRNPVSTFVDIEGNIVWTQEYLRYRVTGCSHIEATVKVFQQIDGRGVAPPCNAGGGSVLRINGSVGVFNFTRHQIDITGNSSNNFTMVVGMVWPDPTVDLDLYLTSANCMVYPPGNCNILTSSRATSGTTEVLAWEVRVGESYAVWVDNFSQTKAQNYELTAFLTFSSLVEGDSPGVVKIGPGVSMDKPPDASKEK